MSHLTPSESDGKTSTENLEVLPLPSSPDFSDGDQNTWPKEAYWKKPDDWLYRHKLAMMWMQKSNQAVKGKFNILLFY